MSLFTRLADKAGLIGSVVSAAACVNCFPALASLGAAIASGYRWSRWTASIASGFSLGNTSKVSVSFATAAARERAPKVMDSDAWKKLSATRDDRVFAVNNEVWQSGQGVIAARGIVEDLRWLNAPIN